jgi:uncharacterized Zn-binding protein involved in type VI secretion
MGDKITGLCPNHLLIGPLGVPIPSPAPLPFSAPITLGTVPTVLIGGKPAAVAGSSGLNTPPHVGLHGTDPFLAPPTEIGRIVAGSPTVLIGGKPAASATSTCTCCVVPGALVPTVKDVMIG